MNAKRKKPIYKPSNPICRTIGGKPDPLVTIMGSTESGKQIAEENAYLARKEEKERQTAIQDGIIRAKQVENENSGVLGFSKAVRDRNLRHAPIILATFVAMPKVEIEKLHREYDDLLRKRGIPLSSEDQLFGKMFLENLLLVRPLPVDPNNYAQRLKEAVSQSPF